MQAKSTYEVPGIQSTMMAKANASHRMKDSIEI